MATYEIQRRRERHWHTNWEVSLLFKPSGCVEELRTIVKRLRHGFEEHPAWTNVFRVECQTQGAGRPK